MPGDRILVRGNTDADFSPEVRSEKITLLRHGPAPTPVPATFEELIRGQHEGVLVTVSAVVRAADLEERSNLRNEGPPIITAPACNYLRRRVALMRPSTARKTQARWPTCLTTKSRSPGLPAGFSTPLCSRQACCSMYRASRMWGS